MSDYYFEREQSEAKHAILGRYLYPFAKKVLFGWKSLDFIDGFAGPWKNRDETDLSDTSIGVALRTLSKVAKERGHKVGDGAIRCIFNEKDPIAFGKLHDFVEANRGNYPLIDIRVFQGEFEANAAQIRQASSNGFRLLFVDPTGHTGFPPETLKFFAGRSTEVFVNFMRVHMNRFVSGDHPDREKHLVGLLGDKRARFLLDTGLSIETLEEEYLKMLRADLGYKYAGMSPIHDKDKSSIHFNLAYATNHEDGINVMREAEFGALSEYDRTRFKKKTPEGQGDLFGAVEDQEIRGPYLQTRHRHKATVSDAALLLAQSSNQALPFEELAAILQQSFFLMRTEIADAVKVLADQGLIQATWMNRGPEKPTGKKPRKGDLIIPVAGR